MKRISTILALAALLALVSPVLRAEDPAPADPLGDSAGAAPTDPAVMDDSVGELADEDVTDGDEDAITSVAGSTDEAKELRGVKARFDENKDGKLSAEERAKALDHLKQRRHDNVAHRLKDKADANHDGQLDDAEKAKLKDLVAAHKQRVGEVRDRLKKRWDRNGDGQLDKEERKRLHKVVKEWHDRRKKAHETPREKAKDKAKEKGKDRGRR